MRWLLIPVALATVAAFAFAAPGQSDRAPAACTWTGTPQRDVKSGTGGVNVLCALPGKDFIHGRGGNDILRAGGGRDVAVGGGGRDIVRGGGGPDRLFAVDDAGGDRIYGGVGIDECFVDAGDQVFGCERAFLSNEPVMATALQQSLGQVIAIAEDGSPVPPSPSPVIITTTVTVPPCNEGPPEPPPFCGT